MFYMVSENGNAHRKVNSEHKRDELIALGYHVVEEPAEVAAVDPPAEGAIEGEQKPKKGKTKKNAAEE